MFKEYRKAQGKKRTDKPEVEDSGTGHPQLLGKVVTFHIINN